jgi:TonB family protein
MTRTLLVLLFLLSAFSAAPARTQQEGATHPATQAESYPNTSDGLRSFLGAIFRAIRARDTTKENALIQSLLMPDDSTWFTDVYGPGFGASLASAYRREKADIESEVKAVYETNVEHGWIAPEILRYTDPEKVDAPIDRFLNCMNQIVPLYATASQAHHTAVMLALQPGGKSRPVGGDLDGFYIYDRDNFRYIPMDILITLPEERPVRIQLGWNVMSSKLLNEAYPRIPREAIEKHISGRVVIDLILDVNGNIKESKVLEGDPILSAAVMDVVKQYRFAPTALDGDPVEVEVQFPFEFHIN